MAQYTATVRPVALDATSNNFSMIRFILKTLILLSVVNNFIFAVLQVLELNVVMTVNTEELLLSSDLEPMRKALDKRKMNIVIVSSCLVGFKLCSLAVVLSRKKTLIKIWTLLVVGSCLAHVTITDFDSLTFEIVTFLMFAYFVLIDKGKPRFKLNGLCRA